MPNNARKIDQAVNICKTVLEEYPKAPIDFQSLIAYIRPTHKKIHSSSVNAVFILLAGGASFSLFLMNFFLPTLLGNIIIGGVAFVAAINHAQVIPGRNSSVRGSHP